MFEGTHFMQEHKTDRPPRLKNAPQTVINRVMIKMPWYRSHLVSSMLKVMSHLHVSLSEFTIICWSAGYRGSCSGLLALNLRWKICATAIKKITQPWWRGWQESPVSSHEGSFSNSHTRGSRFLGLCPVDGERGQFWLYDVRLQRLQRLLLCHRAVA